MVLRDRLTVVDVWFGFQVDGKLASKCRTGFSPGQWNDLRVIQRRLYWSCTSRCCTSIDRAAVFLTKELWQTGQVYHRLIEPRNSRDCHCIFPMTEASSAFWSLIFHQLENRTRHQLQWACHATPSQWQNFNSQVKFAASSRSTIATKKF